jgi:PAS domain S-box-containing protein
VSTSRAAFCFNNQTEQVFGYPRGELLGQPVELLVPDRYHGGHESHRAGYFENPVTRPMGAEFSLFGRRRDGTEFPAEISLSSIETADGVVAIAAVRDVTERLVAESVAHEEAHRRTVVSAMPRAEEAERARIATSLHDDTVQVMTASLMSLDRVCRSLGEKDALLLAQVEDTRRTIAEATERTRRLSFELRPAVLHEPGLTPAITAMVEQAGREIGADVSVHLAPGRFDWPVEELSTAPSRKRWRTFASTPRRGGSPSRSAAAARGCRVWSPTTAADSCCPSRRPAATICCTSDWRR